MLQLPSATAAWPAVYYSSIKQENTCVLTIRHESSSELTAELGFAD